MDRQFSYVECQGHQDQRARKDFEAILDFRVQLAWMVHADCREPQDQKETEENADLWDPQASQDPRVTVVS